jgi:PAS domain S-box-containing protein
MVPAGDDLRALLETNGAAAFALEATGRGFVVLAANARHGRLTGLEAVVGLTPAEFLPPEEAEALEAGCRRCAASGTAVEFEGTRTPRRGETWCRTILVPARIGGGPVRIFATLLELPGRRHTELVLRPTDRRLAAVFETANAGILLADAETGRILIANPHLERLLGHPIGGLAGTALEAIVAPGEVPGLERQRARARAGILDPHSAECRLRRADGSEFVGEVAGSFFREMEGGRPLWVVSVRDLSPVRVLQQRLADALEASNDGFALFDELDRLVVCNHAFAAVYGRTPSELRGTGFEEMQRRAWRLGTGPRVEPGEYEAWLAARIEHHRRADGAPLVAPTRHDRWFMVQERRTGEGWTTLVRTDITEFKRRERALEENETLLRHGAELARLGYWVWDEVEDRCLHCSPVLAAIHGLSVERFLAGPGSARTALAECLHPDDRDAFLERHATALAAGTPLTLDLRLRVGPREELRHVRAIVDFFRDASGGVVRSLGVMQDITGHKHRELELERARAAAEEASRAKSDFLAHMSHELRTPLNAIIGFSDLMLLQLDAPLPARYEGYLRDVHTSACHLLDLINGLLDLAKIEAGRFELDEGPVEVEDLLARSARFVAEAAARKSIELRTARDARLSRLRADGRALQQILVNLLSNAVKFTPEGGRVEMVADLREGRPTITVADTGIGIPAEEIALVLQPFAQSSRTRRLDATGTGLGLPIVRSLVELHGGEIGIESDAGQGTRITVKLPAERLEGV